MSHHGQISRQRQKSQEGKNLRVRRTHKLLREALIELIEERGFEALTVGEIAERAMVSRAAFYRNYHDKYDLVEQIFSEALRELLETVPEPGAEHPPRIWAGFFEHIAKYERLYRALLGRKGSPWFALKMRAALADLLARRLPVWQAAAGRTASSVSDEFTADLLATLFVETITWWLERSRPHPPQEMAKRCARLTTAILRETSTWP